MARCALRRDQRERVTLAAVRGKAWECERLRGIAIAEADLVERVKHLERDSRRFKAIVLVSLVLLFGGIIYACAAPRNPSAPVIGQTTSAREFNVVDSSGRVRIRLSVSEPKDASSTAEISVLDSDGKERVALDAIDSGFENLAFLDGNGNSGLRITAGNMSSEIGLYGGPSVGPLGTSTTGPGTQQMSLDVSADGRPAISLADAQGFSMSLGSASLGTGRTGQTHQTSAAFIVMFGNDKEHRVVWQAP